MIWIPVHKELALLAGPSEDLASHSDTPEAFPPKDLQRQWPVSTVQPVTSEGTFVVPEDAV